MDCPIAHWTAEDQAAFLDAWCRIGELVRDFEQANANLSERDFLRTNLSLWRFELFESALVVNHPLDSMAVMLRMGIKTVEHFHWIDGIKGILEMLRLRRQFHLTPEEMQSACAWATTVCGDE